MGSELPDDQAALLAWIRGEGHPYGPGMRTHPASTAADDRAKHAACLELERRGLIARRIDAIYIVI
jgi:hypothetical protein